MLRRARTHEASLITALWTAPENAMWIEPPDTDEIGDAITRGHAFLWCEADRVTGFATMMTWVPEVYGLSALVATRPGTGRPLMQAVLTEVFGRLGAHRIGFDVTADNLRALRLYESLGFQREGLIRECWRRPDGEWTDCLLMGLLRREWEARQS